MNKQELIEKYKRYEGKWNGKTGELARQIFLEDLKQLDEPKPVKVPQVVADWIDYFKKTGDWDLFQAMDYLFGKKEIREWLEGKDNQEIFARAWLDGYEVEEEKKYKITLLNRNDGNLYLVNQNAGVSNKNGHFSPTVLLFTKGTNFSEKCYKLTKKEVVLNDFGWVFDCSGIEVQEVD